MFDSPLHFCPSCRAYVALDESLEECAARHHCDVARCPIAILFSQYVADRIAANAMTPPAMTAPGSNLPTGIP